MTRSQDYLFGLLPAVYRIRDEAEGHPLRDLLRVVTAQVNVVEEDIARLYDNWFIETCDDWVVPYIGDLVGYEAIPQAGAAPEGTDPSSSRLRRVLTPRADVANTIASRRRKGTLALLDVLAAEVAGWPAHAVEAYRLLGWTQHLDHRHLERGRSADLRSGRRLDRLGGPFDGMAHGVDVRRPGSHRTPGLYDIPSVGVHLWRLRAYPVTQAPANCIEREGTNCYTFSVLGNDTPLFTSPRPDAAGTVRGETSVPAPIRRRAFEHRLSDHPLVSDASTEYYGVGRSLSVEVSDWPRRHRSGLVAASDIVPADLSDWHAYRPPRGKVLLDPALGRLVFPPGQAPTRVRVSYHYGFAADVGGGEYRRPISSPAGARVYRVRKRGTTAGEFRTIRAAYRQWRQDVDGGSAPPGAVLEVADSDVYEERLVFRLARGESLQLRAAQFTRPVLRLLDYRVDQPDPFTVQGHRASRFVLDGFLVTGRGVVIRGARDGGPEDGETGDDDSVDVASHEHDDGGGDGGDGDMCDVVIRHCTLVPGWDLDCDCTPRRPDEPSLVLDDTRARVTVDHSIIGSVLVLGDERRRDPAPLEVADSVVDATSADGVALSGDGASPAFVVAFLRRCTVVGEVAVHALELAENCLFTSRVRAARRQVGCVRYCYLPDGSRTPRRYGCQPETAVAQAIDDLRRASAPGVPTPDALARVAARTASRVRPVFESMRYGAPTYLRLDVTSADEITAGADDESELGAYHDLFQPQRLTGLRLRLDEYTPAGMDSGIVFAT